MRMLVLVSTGLPPAVPNSRYAMRHSAPYQREDYEDDEKKDYEKNGASRMKRE